ncbi:hypothetical protein Tco_0466615, partial [Tanacetum coccineum]
VRELESASPSGQHTTVKDASGQHTRRKKNVKEGAGLSRGRRLRRRKSTVKGTLSGLKRSGSSGIGAQGPGFHDSVGQKRKRPGNFRRWKRKFVAGSFVKPIQMAAENMGSKSTPTQGINSFNRAPIS